MNKQKSSAHNELPGATRVEAFSDGVLAIVITLLVLEIKVPHLESAQHINTSVSALLNLAPKFLGYFLSFFFIAVFWVNHHRFFRLIESRQWLALAKQLAPTLPFFHPLSDCVDRRISG